MKKSKKYVLFMLLNLVFDICFYIVYTRAFPLVKADGFFTADFDKILFDPKVVGLVTAITVLMSLGCFLLCYGVRLRLWRKLADFIPRTITRRVGGVRLNYEAAVWRHFAITVLLGILAASFVVNIWSSVYLWSFIFSYVSIVFAPIHNAIVSIFSMPHASAMTVALYTPQIVYQAFVFVIIYLFMRTVFVTNTKEERPNAEIK